MHKIDRLSTSDTSRRYRAFPQIQELLLLLSLTNILQGLLGGRAGGIKSEKHSIQGSNSSVPNLFF